MAIELKAEDVIATIWARVDDGKVSVTEAQELLRDLGLDESTPMVEMVIRVPLHEVCANGGDFFADHDNEDRMIDLVDWIRQQGYDELTEALISVKKV